MGKSGTSRSEVDVAVIDDCTVMFQACNDVFICAVAASSENELVVLQLVEGIFSTMTATAAAGFLASGITKELVLENLSDVLFILDEVVDDGVIMEHDQEKLSSRIKMIDETEVSAQNEMFQKATQSAKSKLLGSLLGG